MPLREAQPLTEKERQALAKSIPELRRSVDEVWQLLDLPSHCRVLVEDQIDGWSVELLRDYLRKHLSGCDEQHIDRMALRVISLQLMVREARDAARSLECGLWPPPPMKWPECDLAKERRMAREQMPKAEGSPAAGGVPVRVESWEKRRDAELKARREANGYKAPGWSLTFTSHKLDANAGRQTKVVRHLMKAFSNSLPEAQTVLTKLMAGEAVQIPLAKRSDWYPLRNDLADLGVKADIQASYGVPASKGDGADAVAGPVGERVDG